MDKHTIREAAANVHEAFASLQDAMAVKAKDLGIDTPFRKERLRLMANIRLLQSAIEQLND